MEKCSCRSKSFVMGVTLNIFGLEEGEPSQICSCARQNLQEGKIILNIFAKIPEGYGHFLHDGGGDTGLSLALRAA